MIAGATLSNNQGVAIATDFGNAIASYTGTTLLTPLFAVYANSTAGGLTSSTLLALETMANNTCPALADNTPLAYANTLGNLLGNASLGNSIAGFTGVITDIGNTYLGTGSITVFAQVFSASQGYITVTNDFINTSINSQTYLGSTFTTMNSLVTGNLTDVSLATTAFGQDLSRLGLLIDLANLDNFGTPGAVFRQLAAVTNLTPGVKSALVQVGLNTNTINNFTNPTVRLTDTEQYLAYQAMLNITGTDLEQVLAILDITTSGINTMADLLNPVKIFPNSFGGLTVRTYNQNTTSELRAIYADSTGTVNSNLLQYLPRYVITVVP